MRWQLKKTPFVLLLCSTLALSACSLPWVKPPAEPANAPPQPELATEEPLATTPAVVTTLSTTVEQTTVVAVTDSWQQLAAEFSWPSAARSQIDKEIARLTRHPQGFQRYSKNAEPFLAHILTTLRARNLPAELALIPLIESGYRANAVSPYGASGLWQFMPATASRFGLKRSAWYDARKDVVASTKAALDYLEYLYREFDNDWLRAIAAYNCGPATVRRAMRKSPSSDFWTLLAQLPPETRRHIPRLLAAIAIVAAPAEYGIKLHPIATTPHFTTIELQAPLRLSRLNDFEEWPKTEFSRLNAGFERPFTGPNGPFQIHVPVLLEARVVDFIASLPARDRVLQANYTVRNGDTLSAIAARYGTTVKTIQRDNNLSGHFLKVGRELVLGSGELALDKTSARAAAASYSEHVVKRGDSLWTIARRYQTSTRTLANLNNLPISTTLQPGQRLRVLRREPLGDYAVKSGDSLWTIARKFNITVKQLRAWNSLPKRRALQPGQRLVVARPSSV